MGFTAAAGLRKTKSKLDLLGQYYAALLDRRSYGDIGITMRLKEPLDPHTLQMAADDLVRRYPFLNAYITEGLFTHHLRVSGSPLRILPEAVSAGRPETRSGRKNRALRLTYGERHFTIETSHRITDGRGMVKIAAALLVRYFELTGLAVNKPGTAAISESFRHEEAEDAYIRYGNAKNAGEQPKTEVYRHKVARPAPVRVISKTFCADRIKSAAKAGGATVSEYLLAIIFAAVAEERNAAGAGKPISARVPIDCRRFFPSETLRNFTASALVYMPETSDAGDMINRLRPQFAKIDADYVLGMISLLKRFFDLVRFLPLFIKKGIILRIWRGDEIKSTISFSNIGLVSLPPEVEERLETPDLRLAGFFLGMPRRQCIPHRFVCLTLAGRLAMFMFDSAGGHGIFDRIARELE
jgi:hypothetical protein